MPASARAPITPSTTAPVFTSSADAANSSANLPIPPADDLGALPVLLLPSGASAAEPPTHGVARGLLTRHGERLILAPCQEGA